MRATNITNKKEIKINASYLESHLIGEALSSYRLVMQRIYGINSKEEKHIAEMVDAIRNPTVKKENDKNQIMER